MIYESYDKIIIYRYDLIVTYALRRGEFPFLVYHPGLHQICHRAHKNKGINQFIYRHFVSQQFKPDIPVQLPISPHRLNYPKCTN